MSKKTTKKAASKKLVYPFAPELYVVEMWSEQHEKGEVRTGWAPTTDASIEFAIAKLSLPQWKRKCPDDKFRIALYRRVHGCNAR